MSMEDQNAGKKQVEINLSIDGAVKFLPTEVAKKLRTSQREAVAQILKDFTKGGESPFNHTEFERHGEHERFAMAIE
jgi:hypothetical protein